MQIVTYSGNPVQRGLSLNGQLGSIMMRSMAINMNDEHLHTLAQMQTFLDGTLALFHGPRKLTAYDAQGNPNVQEMKQGA